MERVYEATFIIKPDVEEETRNGIIERIKSVITANNGNIIEADEWGSRKLAYEINDYKIGYYTLLTIKAEADLVDELERNFRIIDDIIRYLVIRVEE